MDWFSLAPHIMVLLFLVAMLAGFIDAIAGGGGLLTVPVLLSVGISPSQVLATNKLQSVGGSFSASLYFVSKKVVNLSKQKWAILFTFIGSSIGALSVQYINADALRRLMPLFIIGIALYFLFSPGVGKAERQQRLKPALFAIIIGLLLGFYDGFFGPGAGSLYALAYVTLCGTTLATGTAHAKVLNFTSNFAGLLMFILGGKVIWSIGLLMLMGQIIGARLGAKMVMSKGQSLIRPMIITLSLVMSAKLIYDNHSEAINQFFVQLMS